MKSAWWAAALLVVASSGAAHAASPLPLASFMDDWWLNTNYAEHGRSIDTIFYFVFWLTSIITVVVEAVLVWFLIKYRHRPGCAKGIYSHGNTRFEMIWTVIPAIILIVLAIWTKRVWDDYRYSPIANDPNRVQIMVIGEQFKWNVIYPGPSGKIGRYLIYPKSTDLNWPTVPPGKDFKFPNVRGPAYMPEEQARQVLTRYIGEVNPLGRDYSDPNTDPLLPADRRRLDDLNAKTDRSSDEQKELDTLTQIENLNDYSNANARTIVVPLDRPVEFLIGSRDVLHDFFLPNFRTKLDAVPGMKGKLYLKATTASKDLQLPPRAYSLDELQDLVVKQNRDFIAVVNESSPGAEHYVKKRPHKADFWRYASKDGETIVRDGYPVTADTLTGLRAAGIEKIIAFSPFYWDVVCEELCGPGHKDMNGKIIVVHEDELQQGAYKYYFPPSQSPGSGTIAAVGAVAVETKTR